ncbi:MAG: diaminopimelate epimerase, partial [Clostridia bacterium]|nr:diaminopimelate epimerase [Clostridia bacterium]
MEFVKMHGLGNDFIFIEESKVPQYSRFGDLARKLCHRHFGIGADGLIIVAASNTADAKMRMFNPDGSEAEMCGNAIRCFGKYTYERGLHSSKEMIVETLAGLIKPKLNIKDDEIISVTVDMGKPRLYPDEIPVDFEGPEMVNEKLHVGDMEFKITCVSMGNPHCVIFTPQVEKIQLSQWGPKISQHPIFPQSTNVEFVQVIDSKNIKMRVWERGAGETLACGTGACASAVAGVLNDKCQEKVNVSLPGGNLEIHWKDKNHVYMTGPAEEVFKGKI